jgi:hypothetical protein
MLFTPQGTCSTCEIQYAFVYQSGAHFCAPSPTAMDFQGATF